jgi:hypothetical protein
MWPIINSPVSREQDGTSVYAAGDIINVPVTGNQKYAYAYEVLDLINVERAKVNADPLEMRADYLDAAMLRAAECALYFSHTRPNNENWYSVLQGGGYMGENIAIGYMSPTAVVDGWMNSAGHRANILNKNYKYIGIGSFSNKSAGLSWAQCFTSEAGDVIAKPADSTKTFNVPVSLASHELNIKIVNSDGSQPNAEKLTVGKNKTFNTLARIADNSWTSYATLDSGKVTWTSSSNAVKFLAGKIVAISVGKATVEAKVETISSSNKISVTVNPTKTSVSKIKLGKRKMTVSWKPAPKAQAITNYEIRWKQKDAIKWSTKIISSKKNYYTINKLKTGKKYSVQVRSFKNIKTGEHTGKYYSAWSSVKSDLKIK